MIDPALLAVLACPTDHGELYYFADRELLYNPRLARSYPIVDGIVSMLVEEAVPVDDGLAAELDGEIADGQVPVTGPQTDARA